MSEPVPVEERKLGEPECRLRVTVVSGESRVVCVKD